jgi:hypothetical protein
VAQEGRPVCQQGQPDDGTGPQIFGAAIHNAHGAYISRENAQHGSKANEEAYDEAGK